MNKHLLDIINIVLINRNKPTFEKLELNYDLRNDIGFDSLDLAELTVRIEAFYNIDIFEKGLINTIQEIVNQLPNE